MLLNSIISKAFPNDLNTEYTSGRQPNIDLGRANGIKNMVEQAQTALDGFIAILADDDKQKFVTSVDCLSLEEIDNIITNVVDCNTKYLISGKVKIKDIIALTDLSNDDEKRNQKDVNDRYEKFRCCFVNLKCYLRSEVSVIKTNEEFRNIDEGKLCAKTISYLVEKDAMPTVSSELLDKDLPDELKPIKPNENLSRIDKLCLWVFGFVSLVFVLVAIFVPNSFKTLFDEIISKKWLSVLMTIVAVVVIVAIIMSISYYVLKNMIPVDSKAHDKEMSEYYNYIREYRDIYYAQKRMELHRDEVAIGLYEKRKKTEIDEMARDNESIRKVSSNKQELLSELIEKAAEIDKSLCTEMAKACRCGSMLNYCESFCFQTIKKSMKDLPEEQKRTVERIIKERHPLLKCLYDTKVVIWGIKNHNKYNIFLIDNNCKSMIPLAFDTEIAGVIEDNFSIEINY